MKEVVLLVYVQRDLYQSGFTHLSLTPLKPLALKHAEISG